MLSVTLLNLTSLACHASNIVCENQECALFSVYKRENQLACPTQLCTISLVIPCQLG